MQRVFSLACPQTTEVEENQFVNSSQEQEASWGKNLQAEFQGKDLGLTARPAKAAFPFPFPSHPAKTPAPPGSSLAVLHLVPSTLSLGVGPGRGKDGLGFVSCLLRWVQPCYKGL